MLFIAVLMLYLDSSHTVSWKRSDQIYFRILFLWAQSGIQEKICLFDSKHDLFLAIQLIWLKWQERLLCFEVISHYLWCDTVFITFPPFLVYMKETFINFTFD